MRVDIDVDARTNVTGLAPIQDYPNRIIVRQGAQEAHFLGSLDDLEDLFTKGLRSVESIRNPHHAVSVGPVSMELGPWQ